MEDNIISESKSPSASPAVLVSKKDETTWFCEDYSKLNKITIRDSYLFPRIDGCLNALSESFILVP